MDLLEEWAAAYGSILILSGPIFDYNVDGLKDTEFELYVDRIKKYRFSTCMTLYPVSYV